MPLRHRARDQIHDVIGDLHIVHVDGRDSVLTRQELNQLGLFDIAQLGERVAETPPIFHDFALRLVELRGRDHAIAEQHLTEHTRVCNRRTVVSVLPHEHRRG